MAVYTKERVELLASDKAKLVASYYEAKGDKGIIFLHQFKQNRDTYDKYASSLQKLGYPILTIDFRGHGESHGTTESLQEKDFIAMINDVKEAARFMNNKNKEVLCVIGSSIGANTAFNYASDYRIPAVLLSPGLNYKGIDIQDTTCSSAIFIIATAGDNYSAKSSREIYENNLFGPKKLKIVAGSSKHGVFMLDEKPELFNEIKEFLKKLE